MADVVHRLTSKTDKKNNRWKRSPKRAINVLRRSLQRATNVRRRSLQRATNCQATMENITQKVGERIDSFSLNEFKRLIESHIERRAKTVTLDLIGTKFLSIPCIKLIAFWASQLQLDGRRLILLGATEKLKRQIGIFGSLDHLTIKKTSFAPEERPAVGLPVHDESLDF